MPTNIKQKVQQIIKNLQEKDFEIIKVKKAVHQIRREKLRMLIRECEQLYQNQAEEKI